MGFRVYDENGYVGDFATTKGCDDFMKWLKSTEDEDLMDFADNGIYIVPEALAETLVGYQPPKGDIKSIYDNFLELLPKCEGIVMISDEVNDDLEDLEE